MSSAPGLLPLACAAWLALAAAAASAETLPDHQRQLDTVEQQLLSAAAATERIEADIAAARDEQERIAARLAAISQRIQSEEAAITASELEVERLSREEVVILADLGAKQDALSELLAGLQQLEQNPPPALVVEPGDILAALRGAMLFGTIVPELRDEADNLARNLARLEQVRAGLKTRKGAIRGEIARLETSRGELNLLIATKQSLVASGNQRLDAERQRAAALAAKAKSLKQLLADLASARKQADDEAAKQAATDAAARKKLETARLAPRLAFAKSKGRLAYPAQGQIIRRYGDSDGLGGTVRGLFVSAREDAQVTAPADGHVEFAGPFRSYGEVLILDPGGGYHILLAGIGRITAVQGEFLRAGEPVGTMGGGPSSVTLLGDVLENGRSVLYIEFRNNLEAIDSAPWWIGGSKEARG